ncbi:MAG: hypothetical protein A4S09_16915 [Proteobacteria bacterium SG_bin7]|nr:MAG: hypothetical protein A4S09_16915 [Proteobacteria bacterium SG_bin7]
MRNIFFIFILFLTCSVLAEISPEQLEHKITQKITAVEEFTFIRETAEKMGLRVWLFGGTAAGYAHYVKWDLLREQGDKRYQGDRFDYDFTNIYRSTQDLDIVADGTLEQIDEFAQRLSQRYPHFLGSKAKWEVRSLRFSRGTPGDLGYKEALLNDYDFVNQNTDSNSTGMVEITKSRDPVVRDLKDWDARRCNFFNDVLDSKIHYYHSPLHHNTSRAKVGNNPEIFSVIRALTKAFQYELTLSAAHEREIKKVIKEFDAKEIKDSNTERRLIDMGKKLFKHAVNIEYAWNTLERLGLRKKLMAFDDANQIDSLSWWMNKEPLRTFKVGQGKGRTARELGIDIVAHEANTFLAYESITRAHTGDPNFLISRDGFAGEAAAFGDGTYTKIGKLGAASTGFTIRMHIRPEARENSDFVKIDDFVILLNKAAATIIPESINMSAAEYFRFLANGKTFPDSEKALLEKFKRRWSKGSENIPPRDRDFIVDLAKKQIGFLQKIGSCNETLLREFFSHPVSLGSAAFVDEILNMPLLGPFHEILGIRHWTEHPKWVSWMNWLVIKDPRRTILVFETSPYAVNPRGIPILESLINSTNPAPYEAMAALIRNEKIQTDPSFPQLVYQNILQMAAKGRKFNFSLNLNHQEFKTVFLNPVMQKSPYWYKTLAFLVDNYWPEYEIALLRQIFTPQIVQAPKGLEIAKYARKLLDGPGHLVVGDEIFKSPDIPNWSALVTILVESNVDLSVLLFNLDQNGLPLVFRHPDWPKILDHISNSKEIFNPSSFYAGHDFVNVLANPIAMRHPDWHIWIKRVFEKNTQTTFSSAPISSDPYLKSIAKKEAVTLESLIRGFSSGKTFARTKKNCTTLFRKSRRP